MKKVISKVKSPTMTLTQSHGLVTCETSLVQDKESMQFMTIKTLKQDLFSLFI
jgi:hypothetical protein